VAKAINDAVKDFAKKGDVTEAVNNAMDALKTSLQTDSISKEVITEMRETLNQLKENATATGAPVNAVAKELKANKDLIKAIAKGQKGSEEVALKTLFQRSGITGNQQAYELPTIGQMATRKLVLYDLFPKIQLGTNNNGTVRYYDWDEATVTRAASAKAEGAAFDESVAKFQTNTQTLKKIGDTLPVTEEVFEDEEMFAAELGMFLETNVKLIVDSQMATGDGTSNTIKGIVSSSTAFTATAAAIATPNVYDLIVKMSEEITTTGGAKYAPDFAVMNISDINRMKLAKDHNDNYILPPFVSRDGTQVAGITVIECNAITANTCVVGDRRFARIYEKVGVTLSKGLVDNQFIEDTITLKARVRLLFLIREADKDGFMYCSDIDAALVTLAS